MKIQKVDPLNSEFSKKRKLLINKLKQSDAQILYRTSYIVSSIYSLFGEELIGCEFANSYSNYSDLLSSDILSIKPNLQSFKTEDRKLIIKNKTLECYRGICNIYTRWLFEDFEEEIMEGRKAYLSLAENETTKKQIKRDNLKKDMAKLKEHFTDKQIEGFLLNLLTYVDEEAEPAVDPWGTRVNIQANKVVKKQSEIKNLVKEAVKPETKKKLATTKKTITKIAKRGIGGA